GRGPDRPAVADSSPHDHPGNERGSRPREREPDRPGGPADHEEIRELPGIDELQGASEPEGDQTAGEPETAEQARAARDGERDREKGDETARLRERDRIRQMVERPGQEHERENRERAAEDIGGPAARRDKGSERNREQARHHERARKGERTRGEP